MKVIKKFFCIFTVCVIMLSLGIITASADNIDIKLDFNNSDNSLIVSGTLNSVKGNIPLNAILKYNNEIVDIKTARSVIENGEAIFNFEPIKFSDSKEGGEYIVTVSSDVLRIYKDIPYKYASLMSIFEFMTSLSEYMSAKDKEQIAALLNNSLNILQNSNEYLGLSEGAKLDCVDIIMGNTYNVPENCSTSANKKALRTEFGKFEADLYSAIAISSFGSCKNTEELKNNIEKYNQIIGFNEDNDVTEEKETQLYKYVQKAYSYSDFASFVSKKSPFKTKEEVQKNVYEQALLTVVKNAHSSQTKIIMDEFKTLFPINETNLKRISSSKREAVYLSVANKIYDSCTALTAAFDNAVLSEIKKENQGGNSGSGGGGGGGTSGSKSNTSYSPGKLTPAENTETKLAFDDIKDVSWAHNAINYLYEKGIVNGRDKNKFEPMGNVTRAEFIKMTVSAYFPVLKADGEIFSDVKTEDWFSDYVYTAYKNGLVVGNDGKFNPYDNITREDMAVILYRLIAKNNTAASKSFADNDEISAYALDAVYALCEMGVIKGIGDNMFAPKQNATRAQAAQMIYNILKL